MSVQLRMTGGESLLSTFVTSDPLRALHNLIGGGAGRDQIPRWS